MAICRVLKIEKQTFMLKQTLDEVAIALPILSDVAVRLQGTIDTKLIFCKTFIATEDFGQHLLDRLILIDLGVETLFKKA